MDAVFGTKSDFEPEWMTRVAGITGLREYLEQIAPDKPIESIIVEGIREKDIKEFDDGVAEYITHFQRQFLGENEYRFKGNPIMLSLAIKEYGITKKLLDRVENLSIRKCGRIVKNTNSGFGSNIPSAKSHIYRNNEFCILNLLYETGFVDKEEIRNTILARLASEADDLYDFSLSQTKSFEDDGVKKQLMDDKRKYPNLFARKSVCFAPEMSSMPFLIKVFSEDGFINQLLSNNAAGIYSIFNPEIDINKQISADIKTVEQLVKLLVSKKNTHNELLCFLLKIVTELRRKNEMDRKDEEITVNAENKIWDLLMGISVPEESLYELYNNATRRPFRSELIYEYASRKTGNKLDFILYEIDFVGNVFNLISDTVTLNSQVIFIDDGPNSKGRLFRLVNDIGTFRYDECALKNTEQLGKDLVKLFKQNSELLKDVFVDLLTKGFVPKDCLDYVIKKLNNKKKCTYMVPLLITYKYGGLTNDEG